MKTLTLSAPEHLIERARAVARDRQTTLNILILDWLNTLAPADLRVRQFEKVMDDLGSRVSAGGRKLTREELNER